MKVSRRSLLASLGAVGMGSGWLSSNSALGNGSANLFEEVLPSTSGIQWVHNNAISPERYLPETLPPGVAFLDYDNDGWMDIFLVNTGASDFHQPKSPIKNALYKNNRDGTFTDVTDKAGVAGGLSFGQGVAVGDFDNDGFPDIFVTAYGRNTLYKNNGNGTFTDITEKAGLANPNQWGTSAVWFDYNNDGLLDLFVCGFVNYEPGERFACGDNKLGRRYYCIPRVFKPSSSFLYRNNGDGTFTLVSGGTAIEEAKGKSLGVVATDINNDGFLDLFVANDTVQNFLFMNRGGKSWEETGLQSEVAFSMNGQARSGMGVDAADVDGDGWQDLFVANVDQEMFSLYQNNKNETFRDAAHKHSVAQSTRMLSGWGLKFFDYDNDGQLDLILANGHPDDMIEQYSQQVKYKEPLLLFHNDGGTLRNVSSEAGPVFTKSFPARGLAVGDFNNDGKLDVMVGNCGEAPLLLKNTCNNNHRWVGLKLTGKSCNRDAVGAKIVWAADGKIRQRLKTNGGSYLSSHDPREVLGIGSAKKLDFVEVQWPAPSKRIERFSEVALDSYTELVEGAGTAVKSLSLPTNSTAASRPGTLAPAKPVAAKPGAAKPKPKK
jgi:enediyne biosynthesis protein E4